MLKAVVDEHGPSALRLKDAYVNNPKRTEQLLDAFPMSSVLKKVILNTQNTAAGVMLWAYGLVRSCLPCVAHG